MTNAIESLTSFCPFSRKVVGASSSMLRSISKLVEEQDALADKMGAMKRCGHLINFLLEAKCLKA